MAQISQHSCYALPTTMFRIPCTCNHIPSSTYQKPSFVTGQWPCVSFLLCFSGIYELAKCKVTSDRFGW